jgi:cobalt/nickel transport system permease protein
MTDDPLMGVLGAFIFAAQMINLRSGTGSSGHLGGGMILAIILGPHAAFLVMASVLTVQALFFADGGLLALGCNIWNLGFYPCFLVYPLIYKPLIGNSRNSGRIVAVSLVSAIAALQLGAFSVVMETLLSGKSELPFGAFVLLMQPIHRDRPHRDLLRGVINYCRAPDRSSRALQPPFLGAEFHSESHDAFVVLALLPVECSPVCSTRRTTGWSVER